MATAGREKKEENKRARPLLARVGVCFFFLIFRSFHLRSHRARFFVCFRRWSFFFKIFLDLADRERRAPGRSGDTNRRQR